MIFNHKSRQKSTRNPPANNLPWITTEFTARQNDKTEIHSLLHCCSLSLCILRNENVTSFKIRRSTERKSVEAFPLRSQGTHVITGIPPKLGSVLRTQLQNNPNVLHVKRLELKLSISGAWAPVDINCDFDIRQNEISLKSTSRIIYLYLNAAVDGLGKK